MFNKTCRIEQKKPNYINIKRKNFSVHFNVNFNVLLNKYMRCATSRTVPGSIPGGVTGDFFSVVPPTEPCALRSTQPMKVITRNFSWGKGGRYLWLTTYHPCSAETSRKSGALIYPEPLGPPRPVAGDLYLYFTKQIYSASIGEIKRFW